MLCVCALFVRNFVVDPQNEEPQCFCFLIAKRVDIAFHPGPAQANVLGFAIDGISSFCLFAYCVAAARRCRYSEGALKETAKTPRAVSLSTSLS